jgi:hypothetical protein
MVANFRPAAPGCPWSQCEHSFNAHTRDHCMGCECEKPPPPLPQPAPAITVEEFEAGERDSLRQHLDMGPQLTFDPDNICGICSAVVVDREKHVSFHERRTDTRTNLVMSISQLERMVRELQDKVDRMQAQIGALDRAVSPKPAEDF